MAGAEDTYKNTSMGEEAKAPWAYSLDGKGES